jgi:IclR family KDG regulon transcriptional repressor
MDSGKLASTALVRGSATSSGDHAGRPSTAQTVRRTLDVLEALASARGPLGVSELAAKLGMSAAAAHRMLSTLAERGYARQDPASARYSIGPRCFSLATLAASQLDLRAAAAPHLRALNEETGEVVHLALYDDGEVIYIDRLEGKRPVGPISRIGARAPAHCVSTGRAILAHLPDHVVQELVERGLKRYTERSPVTWAALQADREQTRRRGYAINEGSWYPEISGVAAPIRDYTGAVSASLGVCVPTSRFTPARRKKLIDCTLRAARAVSAELGFEPGAQAADGLRAPRRRSAPRSLSAAGGRRSAAPRPGG